MYQVTFKMAIFYLSDDLIFPDPNDSDPEGLLAVGGCLTKERLLLAYSKGIFPWYSAGQPILWWSPDPRLILYPENFHISKSLKRILVSDKFQVKFDHDFNSVIKFCSELKRKGQEGTWITPEMKNAYSELFEAGFAHSVETYQDGILVGGLYGISIGRAFFGESMFSNVADASKVALAALADKIRQWDFDFIDCQIPTDHLKSLGSVEVSRYEFLEKLERALKHPSLIGCWGGMDQSLRKETLAFENKEFKGLLLKA